MTIVRQQGMRGPRGPAGSGGGLDEATADARYVNVAGDAMTSTLTIAGGDNLVLKNPGHKSWFVFADVNGKFAICPSLSADGTDWDWNNVIYFADSGFACRWFGLNAAAGTERYVNFWTNWSRRWVMGGDSNPETGGNTGSDFVLVRYNDSGGWMDETIRIKRTDGVATFAEPIWLKKPTPTSPNHAASKQYVDQAIAAALATYQSILDA